MKCSDRKNKGLCLKTGRKIDSWKAVLWPPCVCHAFEHSHFHIQTDSRKIEVLGLHKGIPPLVVVLQRDLVRCPNSELLPEAATPSHYGYFTTVPLQLCPGLHHGLICFAHAHRQPLPASFFWSLHSGNSSIPTSDWAFQVTPVSFLSLRTLGGTCLPQLCQAEKGEQRTDDLSLTYGLEFQQSPSSHFGELATIHNLSSINS